MSLFDRIFNSILSAFAVVGMTLITYRSWHTSKLEDRIMLVFWWIFIPYLPWLISKYRVKKNG